MIVADFVSDFVTDVVADFVSDFCSDFLSTDSVLKKIGTEIGTKIGSHFCKNRKHPWGDAAEVGFWTPKTSLALHVAESKEKHDSQDTQLSMRAWRLRQAAMRAQVKGCA